MRISSYVCLVFLFLMIACTKDRTEFVLLAEDVSGLSNESKIYSKGLEIGKVEDMKLSTDGDVHIQCSLNSDVKLSSDSDFFLKTKEDTGAKVITVEPGKGKELLSSGDTLELSGHKPIQLLKDLGDTFNELLEDLSNSVENDSVVIDLKELNKQLEEL